MTSHLKTKRSKKSKKQKKRVTLPKKSIKCKIQKKKKETSLLKISYKTWAYYFNRAQSQIRFDAIKGLVARILQDKKSIKI